jgi:hypothetical protein
MKNSNCDFCNKEGLLILPLRYAAVVGDNAKDWLPKMPALLGKGVSDLALDKAAYAPRMMRDGFLYVLINRSNSWYWESYITTSNGYLSRFMPESPPTQRVRFNCNGDACRINASMIGIPKVEWVVKIYLLFSPTALSMDKLDEYKKNPEKKVAEGKLQSFDPKAWAKNKKQEHSMTPEQLKLHVPEFLLREQLEGARASNRGLMLQDQLFPSLYEAFLGKKPAKPDAVPEDRLGSLALDMEKNKSATFVMYDHIGITQELNNFRNAASEPVREFLATVDKDKVSNQRKLDTWQAISDTKAAYVTRALSIYGGIVNKVLWHVDVESMMVLRDKALAKGDTKLADMYDIHIKNGVNNNLLREQQMVNEDAPKDWEKKYGTLLHAGEMTTFKIALDKRTNAATALTATRVKDHVTWVTSARLVDAFDMYDQANLGSGFCFTQEHGVCTFGMFGAPENTPLLKKWMTGADIKHGNLYMRANFYNQEDLIKEAKAAFAEAKKQVDAVPDISHVSSAPWLKGIKGLVDSMKKVDSAWDEWLRDTTVLSDHKGGVKTRRLAETKIHNLSRFHRSAEGKMFARISEWTQALSNKSGAMDKHIAAIVTTLVFSRLGEMAEKIGLEEYLVKIPPEKVKQIRANRDKAGQYRTKADKLEHKKLVKAAKLEAANEHARKVDAEFQRASALAKAEAAHLDNAAVRLLRDEQEKVKSKVQQSLNDLSRGQRPGTNNFRQARLGALLLSIESLGLACKLQDDSFSPRLKWEIGASIASVTGMSVDILYSVTKSIREIEPFKNMKGLEKAADIARGGMKFCSGLASAGAGFVGAGLDFASFKNEAGQARPDWALVAVYGTRSLVGATATATGVIAAYSYAGPTITYMAKTAEASAYKELLIYAGKKSAEAKALRTLWLIRLARFNMIGLAITAAEIGYRCFIKDDDMENWMQACCFRKDKVPGYFKEIPFKDGETELKALTRALEAVV